MQEAMTSRPIFYVTQYEATYRNESTILSHTLITCRIAMVIYNFRHSMYIALILSSTELFERLFYLLLFTICYYYLVYYILVMGCVSSSKLASIHIIRYILQGTNMALTYIG